MRRPQALTLVAGILALLSAGSGAYGVQSEAGRERVREEEERLRDAIAARTELARERLHDMVGRWSFELYDVDQPAGEPLVTGVRVYERNPDEELRLTWWEQLDGSDLRQHGVFAWDRTSGKFYEYGIGSVVTARGFLTGDWVIDTGLIAFRDEPELKTDGTPSDPLARSNLQFNDDGGFTYTVFRRIGPGLWREDWVAEFAPADG